MNSFPRQCLNRSSRWRSKWQLRLPPRSRREDADLAAEELTVDEDAEISPDEEVDIDTGDDDLGVATAGEDDEA